MHYDYMVAYIEVKVVNVSVEVVHLSCSTTRVCVARLHRMSHNQ